MYIVPVIALKILTIAGVAFVANCVGNYRARRNLKLARKSRTVKINATVRNHKARS